MHSEGTDTFGLREPSWVLPAALVDAGPERGQAGESGVRVRRKPSAAVTSGDGGMVGGREEGREGKGVVKWVEG